MIPLLKGLRILDLTSVILGPYATQILGDLGAEIDQGRAAGGRQHAPRRAAGGAGPLRHLRQLQPQQALASCSTSRREAGKAALRKLIPTADAFVHNMRQEAHGQAGLHLQRRARGQPEIVYAAAIGFGRHGRYAGKPAYDDVIQAACGFAGLFQMRDGDAALCAEHRRRQGLGPAPRLRACWRRCSIASAPARRRATSRCRCSS